MRQSGLFITLEGADGCGKSTQAKLLADYLSDSGHEVLLTREPGGTSLAEEIRRVILTPSPEILDATAEMLLYAASRAQHVNHLIKPALTAGKVVICERFIDSSLAYQGYGLGLDLEVIREINRIAVGNFGPNLTFLLDMDLGLCRERLNNRSEACRAEMDRIESRDMDFHEKVRQGFRDLAQGSSRIVLIDVSGKSIAAIHQLMVETLFKRWKVTG
jgi:dTMP kinase